MLPDMQICVLCSLVCLCVHGICMICVCVCMYWFVCVCVCACVCVCLYLYALFLYVWMNVYACVCVRVWVRVDVCVCVCRCEYVPACGCVYVCVCGGGVIWMAVSAGCFLFPSIYGAPQGWGVLSVPLIDERGLCVPGIYKGRTQPGLGGSVSTVPRRAARYSPQSKSMFKMGSDGPLEDEFVYRLERRGRKLRLSLWLIIFPKQKFPSW